MGQARRVLVVDDEALITMLIEDMLGDLGCEVVGPAFDLAGALELAGAAEFDCAILDVNLGGKSIAPVAEMLRARGVPFAFASGYAPSELAKIFPETAILMKPFNLGQVEAVLDAITSGQAAPVRR